MLRSIGILTVTRIAIYIFVAGVVLIPDSVLGDEVWSGHAGAEVIRRLDFNGNFLGSFDPGEYVGVITVVGDEVWSGHDGAEVIRRHDFSGNFLGSFDPGVFVSVATVVPEPSSFGLFELGIVMLLKRSHRRRPTVHE